MQSGVAAAQEVDAAREEQLNAQVQQYVQMMQPLMWRELDFIRQVCDLTPEQRPKIKAAAEAGVKQAARDMLQPRLAVRGRTPASASMTIRADIAKALTATLSAEQLARYSAEAAQRKQADKQAAIGSAVAQIDTALFLNQQQREKIVEAIDANWREGWEQWLMLWQYGGQYYPQIPDALVTPHLSDEQKTVWRGLQKVDFNSWGGGNERLGADNEWWEGKPPATNEKDKPAQSAP
jgi:hypothetical protein